MKHRGRTGRGRCSQDGESRRAGRLANHLDCGGSGRRRGLVLATGRDARAPSAAHSAVRAGSPRAGQCNGCWFDDDGTARGDPPKLELAEGETAMAKTVNEDSGQAAYTVAFKNSYDYKETTTGPEMNQNLGAPRCSYGSIVPVHIRQSASTVIRTGGGEEGGAYLAADLVVNSNIGVWFEPGQTRKIRHFRIRDNQRPNDDVTVTLSLNTQNMYAVDTLASTQLVYAITDDRLNPINLTWCDGNSGSVTEGGIKQIAICADRVAASDYTIQMGADIGPWPTYHGSTNPLTARDYDFPDPSSWPNQGALVMRAGQRRVELPFCTYETPHNPGSTSGDNCGRYRRGDGGERLPAIPNIVPNTGQVELTETIKVMARSITGTAGADDNYSGINNSNPYTLDIHDDDHRRERYTMKMVHLTDGGTHTATSLKNQARLNIGGIFTPRIYIAALDGTESTGVDPFPWTPQHCAEEVFPCRKLIRRTRRSTGTRWSS